MPACVTTFSPEYYEKYGREGLASMARYWPGKVIAYVEGEKPEDCPEGVEVRDLLDDKAFVNFVDWTGKVPFVQGKMPDGSYNYHYNLHKFGRKAFVVSDRAHQEPFFFLGADVRVLKPIPREFLTDMLEGRFGAFLFRQGGMHLESDFAGYNIGHPQWAEFAKKYRSLHTSGAVLALLADCPGIHDCWSLEALLKVMGLRKQCLNISEDVDVGAEGNYHVWPRTALAQYMVHLKGGIKKDKEKIAEAMKGVAA